MAAWFIDRRLELLGFSAEQRGAGPKAGPATQIFSRYAIPSGGALSASRSSVPIRDRRANAPFLITLPRPWTVNSILKKKARGRPETRYATNRPRS